LRDFFPPARVAEIGQVKPIIAGVLNSREPGFEERRARGPAEQYLEKK